MKKILQLKSKTSFLILLPIFLFTFACSEDFLELQPEQAVATNDALVTISDFRAAINGAYDGLSSSDYYGRYFVLVSDIMSDDVKQNASANRASDWAAYAGSSTDNNNLAQGIWAQGYIVIDRVNKIINSEVEIPASVQSEYEDILGQAYAIRALVHHDLVKVYAQHYTFTPDASHMGIPIVTEFDPSAKPARNSVKEVYDQIISDFNTSLGLIDNNNIAYYLTKDAVNALISRVYLYREDWSQARTAATEVINSDRFSLVSHENYSSVIGPELSSEIIFAINFNPTDTRGTDALAGMYLRSGYGDYLPTQDLLDLIPENDARQEMFIIDENLAGNYASKRINKYSDPLGLDKIPVIRLSEVFLNRAEANFHLGNISEAQLGNISEAQEDLNTIRQRGLPNSDDVTVTGTDLLEEILMERRIELSFEGHRLYDLTRNKKGVHRTDCTSSVCDVEYPNDRFILALGQFEIDVNPNIVQNPGY